MQVLHDQEAVLHAKYFTELFSVPLRCHVYYFLTYLFTFERTVFLPRNIFSVTFINFSLIYMIPISLSSPSLRLPFLTPPEHSIWNISNVNLCNRRTKSLPCKRTCPVLHFLIYSFLSSSRVFSTEWTLNTVFERRTREREGGREAESEERK